MGRTICKAKKLKLVSRRENPSIEWYKDGKPQYYCTGMIDARTDMPLEICLECKDYAGRAEDNREAWMKSKRCVKMEEV